MLDQTWDTPNINDTLTDLRTITLSESGEWCVKVSNGLWYLWPELAPEEIEQGLTFSTHPDLKVLVRNEGINHLYF
jgi:hypothetical protein